MRHTVATRLKDASLHEYTIAELLGHENENITTGRYGKKLNMEALVTAVAELDFSGPLETLFRESNRTSG
jgi:integrase